MDLIQFLRVLAKRKLVLVAVPVILVVVTYFLTKDMPAVFKAEAQIATGITEKSHISLEESKGNVQLIDIQQQFSNMVELMRSRKMMDKLSCQLLLHDLEAERSFRPFPKEFTSFLSEQKNNVINLLLRKIDSLSIMDKSIPLEKTVYDIFAAMKYDPESVLKSTKISRVENSDFIKATHESENAYLSAFVVNNVCKNFIDFYKLENKLKRGQTADFFAKLAEEKKKDLNEKVTILKDYKIRNKVINLQQQTENLEILKKDVEMMREKVNQLIPSYSEAIKDIDSRLNGEEKAYLEAGLQPINNKIASLKNKINRYTDILVQSGNKDKAVQDTLANLKNLLNKEILLAADEVLINPNVPKQELILKRINYELELEIAVQSVKSIDRELARLNRKFESFTPLDATIQAYERDIQVAADAYLVILNKLNEASFYTNLNVDVEQTQIAQPGPPEPSQKMMFLILAGLIGFVFTVVVLFVLEYVDLTIKNPEKFSKITGLPLIGILNRLKSEKLVLKEIFESDSVKPETNIFKQLLRTLRHEVEEKMRGSKILLFTSTEQYDGKTLALVSLAFSLGITGKKVLIADTNFGNNSITQSLSAKPMLEKFLRSEIEFNESLTFTSVDNVQVLGSKGGSYSPNEVVVNTVFKEKLASVAQNYDFLFIEGDALNKYSGSKELTFSADKVIAVFSADKVIEQPDRNSVDYIKEMNEKFIGSILNRIELENVESLYGEVAKKRSFIRKFIKKLLKRNLSKKRKNNSNLMKS